MDTITVVEFSKIKNTGAVLLDVRTSAEVEIANLGGTHIPLDELENRFTELDGEQSIYCLCHHGMRSEYAARFLESKGFSHVINIQGGIDAWSLQVDQNISRY